VVAHLCPASVELDYVFLTDGARADEFVAWEESNSTTPATCAACPAATQACIGIGRINLMILVTLGAAVVSSILVRYKTTRRLRPLVSSIVRRDLWILPGRLSLPTAWVSAVYAIVCQRRLYGARRIVVFGGDRAGMAFGANMVRMGLSSRCIAGIVISFQPQADSILKTNYSSIAMGSACGGFGVRSVAGFHRVCLVGKRGPLPDHL